METASVNSQWLGVPALPDTSPNWLAENRELIRMVKAIDASELFGQNSELTFVRDRDTQRLVVRIVNRQTDRVVMQLPPDYVLRLARAFDSGPAPDVQTAPGSTDREE